MVVGEKVRANSLLAGATLLPLFKSHFIFSEDRCIPLLVDRECVGFVALANLPTFRASRFFSYAKVGKVRVLLLKNGDRDKMLAEFVNSLIKRNVLHNETPQDLLKVYSRELAEGRLCDTAQQQQPQQQPQQPIIRLAKSAAEYFGVVINRLCLLGFSKRDGGGWHIWLGKRLPTAIDDPLKYQLLVSMSHDGPAAARETLAEAGYQKIGLQPSHYAKLTSTGLTSTVQRTSLGLCRVVTHCYEIDLSEEPGFSPQCTTPIEEFELVPVASVLDRCHAGALSLDEIPVIVNFCLLHGILTPENERNYLHVSQAIHYDICSKPFPFK